MIAIARKIIEQREGPFDPRQFTDRYEEALEALIADKKKGRKVRTVAEPADTNVVDLMAALRARPSRQGKSRPGQAEALQTCAESAQDGVIGPAARR